MKIKASLGEKIFDIFNYFILACLGFFCFYPLWYVVCAAFSEPVALTRNDGVLFLPLKFTIENFQAVMRNETVFKGIINSVKELVLGTSWQLFCTIIAAYVLSRHDFLLRRPIMLMVTFTMFFSGGTIPMYLNLLELGFGYKAGMISMIIPFSIGTYNMIIMRTAIESMPESLLEAARIDGAGHLKIIWRLVLPLTKATIAVLVLYYGVSHWNSWFWESYLLSRKDMTLSVVTKEMMANMELDPDFAALEARRYALIVVTAIPMIIAYPFLQKYFTQGVMVGAVKQ